jgi:hypothetical protein
VRRTDEPSGRNRPAALRRGLPAGIRRNDTLLEDVFHDAIRAAADFFEGEAQA